MGWVNKLAASGKSRMLLGGNEQLEIHTFIIDVCVQPYLTFVCNLT